MKNVITVYAICKNEEKFVKQWVNSMREADYIVVLDTGSTDNTIEEFRKCGIEPYKTTINPFRFDEARNCALKLCPKDTNIFVSTDLDEIFDPGWGDVLRKKWTDKCERANYKYAWSSLQNGEPGRIFTYDKIHSANWEWKYPVHEMLVNINTGTNEYHVENTLNVFNEIFLHHYPDKTKSRGSYLDLLELRAEEDRNDYYGLIYLGHEYFYRERYKKSISTLETVIERFYERMTLTERASCYLFMGDSYKALGDKDNAIKSYICAIHTESTYREPYLALAKYYLELKEYDAAIFYTKEGVKKSYRHYSWLERDRSWNCEPYDILSVASYYVGNKRDSLSYGIKALSLNGSEQRLKDNLELILNNTTDKDLIF